MIVNVRGTSGSGKSTLIRAVMAQYANKTPIMVEGRKQPIGYLLSAKRLPDLTVLGHYETECGGCDTISCDNATDATFAMVREWHARGRNVLFEGLLISAEANRTIALHRDGLPLLVVSLTTPLEDCLAGIQERRARKGTTRPLGPNTMKNLQSKQKGAATCCRKFREAGMAVLETDRLGARQAVFEALGLPQ